MDVAPHGVLLAGVSLASRSSFLEGPQAAVEESHLSSSPTASDAERQLARELYLKGRYEWNQRTPESLDRALDLSDAERDSWMAQLRLETADYAWVTGELMRIAAAHCNGRLVSVLEGGYDLGALAASAATHVRGLMQA